MGEIDKEFELAGCGFGGGWADSHHHNDQNPFPKCSLIKSALINSQNNSLINFISFPPFENIHHGSRITLKTILLLGKWLLLVCLFYSKQGGDVNFF